ncbi:hypothetical protein U8607_11290 [Methylobacterium durans]|uniref:Uncharacterized protein n=1 Tax=Methylobacterium durans TaxID=2202825 RepID=A0A2U8WDY5_9HYPH|nr:hypothetical protein [Methylobacterium durans]AWN43660.1 hypothetical protein DK389_28060 [Methylobacterium durans]MEA1832665.1 hypothetical protein [Methylobacterium durans]
MRKIKPVYLYRLRLLQDGPRFYAPQNTNRYLEKRGLIQPTGRMHANGWHQEYRITDAGRRALAVEASET